VQAFRKVCKVYLQVGFADTLNGVGLFLL